MLRHGLKTHWILKKGVRRASLVVVCARDGFGLKPKATKSLEPEPMRLRYLMTLCSTSGPEERSDIEDRIKKTTRWGCEDNPFGTR